VGAVAGLIGSSKASKAAKRAARIEAANEKIATDERIKQISQEERTLAGVTRARAAGAGFVITQGSVLNLLAEQAREFERERKITARVGASKVATALAGGKAVAQQYKAQGVGNLFAGLSQAALLAQQAGLFTKSGGGD
jgi:hypothetical protein